MDVNVKVEVVRVEFRDGVVVRHYGDGTVRVVATTKSGSMVMPGTT